MTDTKPTPASPGKPSAADPVVSARAVTSGPKSAFVDATLQVVDSLECEALAIGLTSDVRPLAGLAGVVDWRLCGRLSELVRKGVVTGQAKETVLVPTLGMIPSKRIFLFGWGPRSALLDGATEKLAWMVDVLQKAKVEKVAIALPEPAGMLLGLVDDHLRKPLGDKCGTLFAPDALMPEKDTRPIPMPALGGAVDKKGETSRPDLKAPPKEPTVKSSPRPSSDAAKADASKTVEASKSPAKDGSKTVEASKSAPSKPFEKTPAEKMPTTTEPAKAAEPAKAGEPKASEKASEPAAKDPKKDPRLG